MQEARILLIEDDEALRELMQRNLSARHHTVNTAIDAQSALRQLRTSTFDLIILDINLPDLSGWDVLRIAKRELQYPPTDRGNEKNQTSPPRSSGGSNANRTTSNKSTDFALSGRAVEEPTSTDMQEENLPVVVVSAVRVSPRRLNEFRPLAYLPKPFPMEALLRLAGEAAERRVGVCTRTKLASEETDPLEMDQEYLAPHDVMLSSREEEF